MDAERSVPKDFCVNFSCTFRDSLTLLIVFFFNIPGTSASSRLLVQNGFLFGLLAFEGENSWRSRAGGSSPAAPVQVAKFPFMSQ